MSAPITPAEVLAFWFGPPDDPGREQPRSWWFSRSAATDEQVQSRFAPAIETALAGGFADWPERPEGALALILLLDQMPRNAFRGTARAFAGDARALGLSRQLDRDGRLERYRPLERWFAALPYVHAEDEPSQDRAVAIFTALAAAGLAEPLRWAIRHRDVVRRFGRFPHRNAILGRASTEAELDFLAQPGSSF